jgi:hypothetical protein
MSKVTEPLNISIFILAFILLRPVWPSVWWHQHPWLMSLWAVAWLSGFIGCLIYVRQHRRGHRDRSRRFL